MPNHRNNTSQKSTGSYKSTGSQSSSISTVHSPKSEETSPVLQEPEMKEKIEREDMGITEEEYWIMRKRTAELIRQAQLENYRNYMLNQYNSISYWQERLERLERMREPYNKAMGWSATTVASVEFIDKQIEECLQEIESLEKNSF